MICMNVLSPPIAIHSLFGFPARFLVALVLAAVPDFFALGQRNFALGDAVAKVYPQRDYGQTLGLGAAGQLVDFVLVQQQFPGTQGFMVPRTARHVLRDVGVFEPRAAGLEIDISIANIGLALAKSFNFGAMQDETGLIALQQMIIIRGRAVLRHDLFFAFFGLFGLFWYFGH